MTSLWIWSIVKQALEVFSPGTPVFLPLYLLLYFKTCSQTGYSVFIYNNHYTFILKLHVRLHYLHYTFKDDVKSVMRIGSAHNKGGTGYKH